MDTTKNSTHVGTDEDFSLFQMKYVEFVEDALGAFPEYRTELEVAKGMAEKERMERFRKEVHQVEPFVAEEKEEARFRGNPGTILPGVVVSDEVWSAVSEGTKRAVWEHLRILSICCMMEIGVGDGNDSKPAWMEEMMKEMKEKWESVDMEEMMKKFSRFFSSDSNGAGAETEAGGSGAGAGFPRLPERFLKGQLAKLAQEIVKDITPEDLGITPEQIAECESQPSNAFRVLFGTFTKNPGVLQRTISKIGKRLQQKIVSGAIRPQEIAREAEELMKEFAGNASFVEMMEGLKSAFGMEDMETARNAGRESSARLALVRNRLRRKLEKGQPQAQQKGQPHTQQKVQVQQTTSVPKKKK